VEQFTLDVSSPAARHALQQATVDTVIELRPVKGECMYLRPSDQTASVQVKHSLLDPRGQGYVPATFCYGQIESSHVPAVVVFHLDGNRPVAVLFLATRGTLMGLSRSVLATLRPPEVDSTVDQLVRARV
jgi:hypothetical protein